MGAGFQEGLVEFFTLAKTERDVRALPPEVRSSFSRALAIADQRRAAAEALWPRGATAEALGLVRRALDATGGALDSLGEAVSPRPEWLTQALAVVAGARARTAGVAFPERDADVGPGYEEAFQALTEALLDIHRIAGRWAGGPAGVARLRRKRWVGAAAGLALVVLALARVLHQPTFSEAVASEIYSPDNAAADAIDGDPKTAWVLPDGRPGWIDLKLSKRRPVRLVRVAQGNPPWADRATKDARVETFLGDTLVKAIDVTLADPPPKEVAWTEIPLDSPPCDRIRFTVKTVYKRGGGLVEIEVK